MNLEARVTRLENLLKKANILPCPASLDGMPCRLAWEHDGLHQAWEGSGLGQLVAEWESSIPLR